MLAGQCENKNTQVQKKWVSNVVRVEVYQGVRVDCTIRDSDHTTLLHISSV
jgi:hypothetical protein